jgi:hypothetical protein
MSSYCKGNKTYRAGLFVRSGSDIYFSRREKLSDAYGNWYCRFILMVTGKVTSLDGFLITVIVTFPSLADMFPRLDIALVSFVIPLVSLCVT